MWVLVGNTLRLIIDVCCACKILANGLLAMDPPQRLGHTPFDIFFFFLLWLHTARVIEKTTMIYKPAEFSRTASNNSRAEWNELIKEHRLL